MKPKLGKVNGVILNDYAIHETLGKGTFGKVKLGVSFATHEKVAIKILERNKIHEKEDLDRVMREMSIIKHFDHPNVIQVREILEDTERFYIIMDYCEGGELFNYIVKKKKLSEEEASYFFYQIINGVEHIHSYNVVHRDLKPENLLLGKDHILKIIDFGLSNYFDPDGSLGLLSTPCGSPCYASPEMVSGKKYNGCRIDVWSSGIILFAMLCGYLPFEDPDNDILFQKIMQCNLSFPATVSSLSKDIIRKILITDPEQRITIPEIKKHPFYLEGRTFFKMRNPNFEKMKYNLMIGDLESASLEESETVDSKRQYQSKRGEGESWQSPVKSPIKHKLDINTNNHHHPKLSGNYRISTEPNGKKVSYLNDLFRSTRKNMHTSTAASPESKIEENFYDPLPTEGNEQVLATHTANKIHFKPATNKKTISLSNGNALNSLFFGINSIRLNNIAANDYILKSPIKTKLVTPLQKNKPTMICNGISNIIIEKNPQGIHSGKAGNARIQPYNDRKIRCKPPLTSKKNGSISFNSCDLNSFIKISPQRTANANISREHIRTMKVYDIKFPKPAQRHDVTSPSINLQINDSMVTKHKKLPSLTKKISNESYDFSHNPNFFKNLYGHVIHLNTDGNDSSNNRVNVIKVSDLLKKRSDCTYVNTISSNKAINEKSKRLKNTLNSIKEHVKKLYYKDMFSNFGIK